MILIPHLVIGAAIAAKFNSFPLIIILAILSHYLLDTLPHVDYSIVNIKKGEWGKSREDILKILIDIAIGVIFISIIQSLTHASPIKLAVGAFFGALPDLLTLLSFKFRRSKILIAHSSFHSKIHFLEEKKYPLYLRISTQAFVVLLGFLAII